MNEKFEHFAIDQIDALAEQTQTANIFLAVYKLNCSTPDCGDFVAQDQNIGLGKFVEYSLAEGWTTNKNKVLCPNCLKSKKNI